MAEGLTVYGPVGSSLTTEAAGGSARRRRQSHPGSGSIVDVGFSRASC